MYIGDIGRSLKEQSFSFTNDYKVQYLQSLRRLVITKHNNPYKGLWGEKISNVNLIVGKNGAGKTTVMDLLGSIKARQLRLFQPSRRFQMEWFALYHVEEDIFVVEGYNPDMITNIRGIPIGTSYDYSFCFKYDFDSGACAYYEYIQFQRYEKEARTFTLNQRVNSLYLTNERGKRWYNGESITSEIDYNVGFERGYLNNPSYANLFKFLSKGYYSLEPEFTASEAICEISLQAEVYSAYNSSSELLATFDLKLYQDKNKIIYFSHQQSRGWSAKEQFIILYLEMCILDIWLNQCQKILDLAYRTECALRIEEIPCEDLSYKGRVGYLLEIIDFLSSIKVTHPDWRPIDKFINFAFVRILEQVDERLFAGKRKLVIQPHQHKNNAIYLLLVIVDNYSHDLWGTFPMLNIGFDRLSTGELEFVSTFANLYTVIEVAISNPEIDTILLLLDEPDTSFHPEWSRRYIRNLVLFLNEIEADRNVKFQIIISTHSPFIVSDVPKEHINCIRVVNGHDGTQRTVHQATFGLMSNFYDIIKSDFFIDTPIGEHAKTIFSNLLQEITDLKEYNKERIDQMSMIISGIGDEVIRSKLQQLMRDAETRLLPTREREQRIAELERELDRLRNESRE